MQYIPKVRVQVIRENSLKVDKKTVSSSLAARAIFREYFDGLGETREVFAAISLNTKNVVTAISMISTGVLDASLVHPRETFRFAVMNGASSIIIGHNHPSGDPTPSEADIAVTKRMFEAGKIIGIDVLDSIVVGDTEISLAETNPEAFK